ncbi:hypothetical protein BGX27_003034, partial [Mortierella sp. AM989]
VASRLGEGWWLQNAWGLCSKAATGVPDSFILPGEKTGLESIERRNINIKSTTIKRKSGYKTDRIWRTLGSPDQDWAVAEAATVWDPISDKYKFEGSFKLPRHMHDILSSRTFETNTDLLRHDYAYWSNPKTTIMFVRFFRCQECRLYSDMSQLNHSLDAIHEVLLFRASTLRFMNTYHKAREQLHNAKGRRSREETMTFRSKRRKPSLLNTSP